MGIKHGLHYNDDGEADAEGDALGVEHPGLDPIIPWSADELAVVQHLLEAGGTIDDTADLLSRSVHDVAQVHALWLTQDHLTIDHLLEEVSAVSVQPTDAQPAAAWEPSAELAVSARGFRMAAELRADGVAHGTAESLTEREAVQRSEDRWEQKKRHRQWSQRTRRAKQAGVSTSEQMMEMEIDVMAELDRATTIDKVAHRKAVQASTLPAVRLKSDRVWEQTIAHESSPRRWIDVHTALIPEYCERSVRAVQIDLCPEAIPLAEVSAGRRKTVDMIEAYRSPRHAKRYNAAHFILSWPVGVVPTLSEVAVSSRRMCMRVGLDLHQQGSAAYLHYDRDHYHVHVVVGRSRRDGGLWSPGLGIDRALALESRLLANEHGQQWDQRMVGRSEHSRIGGAKAAAGGLCAKIRYASREPQPLAWQGAEVDKRYDLDYLAQGPHAGVCIAKMVGLRPAHSVVTYCQK